MTTTTTKADGTVEIHAPPTICILCGAVSSIPLAHTEWICQQCAYEGLKWAARKAREEKGR